MKISFRIIVSLLFVAALASLGFSLFQARSDEKRLTSDLEKRAVVLADSLQGSVEQMIESGSLKRLHMFVKRFNRRGNLDGIAILNSSGETTNSSP